MWPPNSLVPACCVADPPSSFFTIRTLPVNVRNVSEFKIAGVDQEAGASILGQAAGQISLPCHPPRHHVVHHRSGVDHRRRYHRPAPPGHQCSGQQWIHRPEPLVGIQARRRWRWRNPIADERIRKPDLQIFRGASQSMSSRVQRLRFTGRG